jgi:hypothetical protein
VTKELASWASRVRRKLSRQHDDLGAGQGAAHQVDRLADAALELILDLDLAWLRCRHGTIVSPGPLAA